MIQYLNSLYKQEKIFKKIKKEKNNLKINEKNIKQRTKIVDSNDLLINKSSNYNLKNLEISILDKNLNNENKYNNNLWNISLRNKKQNGKYENLGYLNVGNKYEPRYTFFNMNRNIEYFSLPEKSKTENIKYNLDFQKFCDEYFNYHTEDIRIKAEKEKKYKELVEKEKEEEEKRAKENAEREKKGEKPKKYDNIKDKIKIIKTMKKMKDN